MHLSDLSCHVGGENTHTHITDSYKWKLISLSLSLSCHTVSATRCYHTISTKAASNWPSYLGQWTGLYHTGQLCGAHTRGMSTTHTKCICLDCKQGVCVATCKAHTIKRSNITPHSIASYCRNYLWIYLISFYNLTIPRLLEIQS